MGVIGLALLALAIGTLVWLFECMRGDDFRRLARKTAEVEALAVLENEVESGASLACKNEAGDSATTV